MTTPQSFAVTFLNYVRAEVQPLIAVADSAGDVVVKSSVKPPETNQTKEPEKKSGVNAVSEAPRSGMENVSPLVGNRGGKDRRKSTGTILQTIQEPKHLQMPVYDDDFPALGNAPNSNAKKNLTQSKQVIVFSVIDQHVFAYMSYCLLASLMHFHLYFSLFRWLSNFMSSLIDAVC